LSNPEKPQPGETSSRISVRASVSSVCHAQLLSGFRAYRVELSPRDRSEFTPEINSLTPRLNLRRNVGLHLNQIFFLIYIFHRRRASRFYLKENLDVASFLIILMSDQLTDFLRVVPHEKTPNYQAALLSVLLIALIIASLIAVLHKVGAVTPYESAISF
jgi:hypothetical protein